MPFSDSIRAREARTSRLLPAALLAAAVLAGPAHAAVFCAADATELQSALTTAAANSADDTVRVATGTFAGGFLYAAAAENFDLTIEGGWAAGCGAKAAAGATTTLDGGDANGVIAVLVTDPVASADVTLKDLVITRGFRSGAAGGGLYAKVPGGSLTVAAVDFSQNVASLGGAIYAEQETGGANVFRFIRIVDSHFIDNSSTGDDSYEVYLGAGAASEVEVRSSFVSHDALWVVAGTQLLVQGNRFEFGDFSGNSLRIDDSPATGIEIRDNQFFKGQEAMVVNARGDLRITNNAFLQSGNQGAQCARYVGRAYLFNASQLEAVNNLFAFNSSDDCYNNYTLPSDIDLYVDNDAEDDATVADVVVRSNHSSNPDGAIHFELPLSPASIYTGNALGEQPRITIGANGDYTVARNSPIVDAGEAVTPAFANVDVLGAPRIQGPRIDVGAREAPAHASLAFAGSNGGIGGPVSNSTVSVGLWNASKARFYANLVYADSGTTGTPVPLAFESMKTQIGVGDLNGNGAGDIAALDVDANGAVLVQIRDSQTRESLNKVPFSPDYRPLWLRALPGAGTGGGMALAVLGVDAAGLPRVQVRDALTGTFVRWVNFNADYVPYGFEVVGDLNGNGSPEFAVTGVNSLTKIRTQVRDSATGKFVALAKFGQKYTEPATVGLDMNGDGTLDAIGVVTRNASNLVKGEIRSTAGALLGVAQFSSAFTVRGAVAVPDINGSGAPEMGVLQEGSDGKVQVQMKDAVSGSGVGVVVFPNAADPRDLIVVPDSSGNAAAELAYLGEGDVGSYQVQVRDALTGQSVSSATIQ